MLLEEAHKWLGWPQPKQIFDPPGEGAKVYADFAKRKIEESLRRTFPKLLVQAGVLSLNPLSSDTSSPLAVVCEFANGARAEELDEAHRLAWNFSRTSLLITLEPHRLIAWSCYCDPQQPENMRRVCELDEAKATPKSETQFDGIRNLLHWVSLITGRIQKEKPAHFPVNGRADRLLLSNLVNVRRRLLQMGLPQSACHDLLARVIFTQYLFHRKDGDGQAFFSANLLERLHGTTLKKSYSDFAAILRSHRDTYALFRWMDDRFNGDLFPADEDATTKDRDVAWKTERETVTSEHLALLADLVSGTINTTDRQLLLWPQYSFDTIPLEFISSVYEEFLNEARFDNKAYYTPSHLVDYLLDAVLPWDGDEWDLKVLDPSCGSGIFLVKAFQRLIHRWKRTHEREPLVSDLKPLLANNIIGVDINPEAVRVACFSLYLAMADAIEPKHYVTREKVFPRLRGIRLIADDFFDETTEGFRTREDGGKYDLVIGNAPWGDGSVDGTSDKIDAPSGKAKVSKARLWAKKNSWPITNHDIGPLFMCKSLALAKSDGRVAMVQPAGPWLYHRGEPVLEFRRLFFRKFTSEEITNLSAIRRELFSDVIGPACIVVAGPGEADPDAEMYFFAPKPLKSSGPAKEFVIEPQDISTATHAEAANDPLVWPVLSLGGQRDLRLIRKLWRHSTIAKLHSKGEVFAREGVIPGDENVELDVPANTPYLGLKRFPDDTFLSLDVSELERWGKRHVHRSTDTQAFKSPQLLIKQALSVTDDRFKAALVESKHGGWGAMCNQTYVSVHDFSKDGRHIRGACLAYNSIFAKYYLAVTSSRIGHYRAEMPAKELMALPLPATDADFSDLKSYRDVDEAVRKALALTKADWQVIEDFLNTTLPDVLRKSPGPGRGPTNRGTEKRPDPELSEYATTLCRVLKGTFGSDKEVFATIYREQGLKLPVRMVSFYFDCPSKELVQYQEIESAGLYDLLAAFHRDVLRNRPRSANSEGIGFQRVVYFFHASVIKNKPVKTLTVIKPDEKRYWTASLGMRDADDLSSAILKAAGWTEYHDEATDAE